MGMKFRRGEWVRYNGYVTTHGIVGPVLRTRDGLVYFETASGRQGAGEWGAFPHLLEKLSREQAAVEIAKQAFNIKQET
jgi:hypothetical protein